MGVKFERGGKPIEKESREPETLEALLRDHPVCADAINKAQKSMAPSDFSSYLIGLAQVEERMYENPDLGMELRLWAKRIRKELYGGGETDSPLGHEQGPASRVAD